MPMPHLAMQRREGNMTSMETRRSDHLAGDDIMTTVTALSRRALQRNSSTCSLVVQHSTVSLLREQFLLLKSFKILVRNTIFFMLILYKAKITV